MTEQYIRDLAARFGLAVDKRITTGTAKAGFATFELTGGFIWAAWFAMTHAHGVVSTYGVVSNPDHPDCGKPYIRIESVYVEEP